MAGCDGGRARQAATLRAVALLGLVVCGVGEDATCPGEPVEVCTGPKGPKEFLDAYAAPSQYDKSLRPPCGDGTKSGPTYVEVQLKLAALNGVSQKAGLISINGYLRTWWTDSRLKYPAGCASVINVPRIEASVRLWLPDLFIDNLVKIESNDYVNAITEVKPDGSVFRSEQVLMTVKNTFELGRLPYDTQTGTVRIASYSLPQTELRLTARDGKWETGESGVGVMADEMTSVTWEFARGKSGRWQTAGVVEEVEFDRGVWDYVTLSWEFARVPKFYTEQVMIPCVLFLFVSYIQFWVDPGAAPARAALAVIPVLIMRTMSNSVYSSLPEGAQQMWLADNLTCSMFLCVAAAAEFGVVQFLLMQEKRKATKLAGLKKVQATAQALIEQSKKEKVSLLALLKRFQADEVEVDAKEMARYHRERKVEINETIAARTQDMLEMLEDLPETVANAVEDALHVGEETADSAAEQAQVAAGGDAAGKHELRRRRSVEAKDKNVKEADLLFIQYARTIFEHYDADDSNHVSPNEIRMALTFFNIYMSTEQTAAVVCMFLRDIDETTPINEMEATLTFSRFTRLCLAIENYTLTRRKGKFGMKGVIARFQGWPPSKRADIVARFLYPSLILVQIILFQAVLGLY